jgi:uncharacterized membrane protein YfcA
VELTWLLYCVLGLGVGTLSGLIGIGGGVLITPALIYRLGFSQHYAQGTTLALLVPPIGLVGAWTYFQQGYVDARAAICICLGFVIGGCWSQVSRRFTRTVTPPHFRDSHDSARHQDGHVLVFQCY